MGLVEIFLKSSNVYQKSWKNIDVFYGQLHTRTIYVKYDLGRKIRYSVVKDLVTIFYCTIPCLLSISPSKGMVSYSAFELPLEVLSARKVNLIAKIDIFCQYVRFKWCFNILASYVEIN